jgi:hypothetical protein
VYRGRPFLIEAAIAFGGELAADDTARVIRFANRVPLLYQQSACSSFKAVIETNWRNYDLQQPRSSVPIGPLVIMIHMASVWVPFTSESKEAIADYDEIRKEMRLALMECGRKLGTYLRKRLQMRRQSERRDVFERYIGEIAQAVNAISGADAKRLYDALLTQARKHTAAADLKLDEEGRKVREQEEADEEGVIIVEQAIAAAPAREGTDPHEPRAPATFRARPQKAASTEPDHSRLLEEPPGRAHKSAGDRKKKTSRRSLIARAADTARTSPGAQRQRPGKPLENPPLVPPPVVPKSPKTDEAPRQKPRLRLVKVNGKFITVEDPKLF